VTQPTSKPLQTTPDEQADQPRTIAFDDAALVAACQQGEMQAFASLIAKYQDRLFNVVFRICSDRDEAADLCQETFVRVIEKIGAFRGQSQFYTWLFRIAVNLAISRRRRAGRVKFASLSPDPELGDGQAEALTSEIAARREAGPVKSAMNRETQQRVLEALEALDDEYRAVVVLRDLEDMDYEQMATVLAVPMGTVKSRLHRGRCMLKEKLVDLVGPD
jgi:RNA polymerase sigma-70 factor, ECF subfamily